MINITQSMIEISNHTLSLILKHTATLSAIRVLCRTGQLSPYIRKAEAYRLYGRTNVEHWFNTGLLTPRKDGDHSASWRIDRLEAETIYFAAQLIAFI